MRAHARCGGSSAARCAGFAEAADATPLSLVSGIAHAGVAAWQAHVVLTTPAHWNATGTVFDGEPDARSAADG